jgi:hypothetical protein
MAPAIESASETGTNGSEKFIDKLKDDGLQRVKTTQRSAAGQLEGVATALGHAGSELDETQPTVAHYVGQLADGINGMASRLKEGSIDDLVGDARRFAKSNPAMFLLGSVGVGMLLARFLKASSRQDPVGTGDTQEDSASDTDTGRGAASTFAANVEDSGVFEPSDAEIDRDATADDGIPGDANVARPSTSTLQSSR